MLHKPSPDNIKEARSIIKEVLLLARQKGVFPKNYATDSSLYKNSMKLWNYLAEKEEFCIRLSQVLTLVSYADALMLMEAAMKKSQLSSETSLPPPTF